MVEPLAPTIEFDKKYLTAEPVRPLPTMRILDIILSQLLNFVLKVLSSKCCEYKIHAFLLPHMFGYSYSLTSFAKPLKEDLATNNEAQRVHIIAKQTYRNDASYSFHLSGTLCPAGSFF